MNKKIYQFFIIFISHRIFWPRMLGQSQAKYVRMIYHLWLEEFLGDPGIRFFYVKIRSLCNPNWLCHIKMQPPFNNSIPPPCPFHGMWGGRMTSCVAVPKMQPPKAPNNAYGPKSLKFWSQDTGLDEATCMLLIGISLLSPDRSGLTEKAKTSEGQEKFIRHLEVYVKDKFGPLKGHVSLGFILILQDTYSVIRLGDLLPFRRIFEACG